MSASVENAVKRAEQHFHDGYNCAESVLLAVTEYLGVENAAIPRVATPFGGGIARSQHTCGAVTGGVMAVGLLLGRDEPKGDRKRADEIAAQFIKWFETEKKSINCDELSGVNFADPEQSAAFRLPDGAHTTVCVPLVAGATRKLCSLLS